MLRVNFNALEWELDETGLFANHRFTGERILLDRFEEPFRDGIIKHNQWTREANLAAQVDYVNAVKNFREMQLSGPMGGEQQ